MRIYFKILIILIFLISKIFAKTNNNIVKFKGFNLFLILKPYIEEEKIIKPELQSSKKSKFEIKKGLELEEKKEIKEEISSDEDILFKNGIELYKNGDWSAAESAFIELLQKYPDTKLKDKATYYLGEIMLKQNRTEEALNYFNKINQEFTASTFLPDSLFNTALIYFNQNNLNESLKLLLTITKKYPKSEKSAKAFLLLGDIYRKNKEYENAIKAYQNVIKKFPKTDFIDNAIFKLAELYENDPPVRNLELAKTYYEKIINYYPDSEFYQLAVERLDFIKKNFLEFK
jgi:TolA-binding protein